MPATCDMNGQPSLFVLNFGRSRASIDHELGEAGRDVVGKGNVERSPPADATLGDESVGVWVRACQCYQEA